MNKTYLPESFAIYGPNGSIATHPYAVEDLDSLGYEVVNGGEPTITFDPTQFKKFTPMELFGYGQIFHGHYVCAGPNGQAWCAPVVSFRYNKGGAGGESYHRLIVRTGVGAGTFAAHHNLPPCETVIGPQIGTYDPTTEQYTFEQAGAELGSKHFPVICYFGGPLGEHPFAADPWPSVGC